MYIIRKQYPPWLRKNYNIYLKRNKVHAIRRHSTYMLYIISYNIIYRRKRKNQIYEDLLRFFRFLTRT